MSLKSLSTVVLLFAIFSSLTHGLPRTVPKTNLTTLKLERKKGVHFEKERWTKRTLSPTGNVKFLLADLLCTHNLTGMDREDVENLLGKPGLERFHKFLNLDKDTVLYDERDASRLTPRCPVTGFFHPLLFKSQKHDLVALSRLEQEDYFITNSSQLILG